MSAREALQNQLMINQLFSAGIQPTLDTLERGANFRLKLAEQERLRRLAMEDRDEERDFRREEAALNRKADLAQREKLAAMDLQSREKLARQDLDFKRKLREEERDFKVKQDAESLAKSQATLDSIGANLRDLFARRDFIINGKEGIDALATKIAQDKARGDSKLPDSISLPQAKLQEMIKLAEAGDEKGLGKIMDELTIQGVAGASEITMNGLLEFKQRAASHFDTSRAEILSEDRSLEEINSLIASRHKLMESIVSQTKGAGIVLPPMFHEAGAVATAVVTGNPNYGKTGNELAKDTKENVPPLGFMTGKMGDKTYRDEQGMVGGRDFSALGAQDQIDVLENEIRAEAGGIVSRPYIAGLRQEKRAIERARNLSSTIVGGERVSLQDEVSQAVEVGDRDRVIELLNEFVDEAKGDPRFPSSTSGRVGQSKDQKLRSSGTLLRELRKNFKPAFDSGFLTVDDKGNIVDETAIKRIRGKSIVSPKTIFDVPNQFRSSFSAIAGSDSEEASDVRSSAFEPRAGDPTIDTLASFESPAIAGDTMLRRSPNPEFFGIETPSYLR